jgi:hypothetical protein
MTTNPPTTVAAARALWVVLLVAGGSACATMGPWVDATGYDDTADIQQVRQRISDLRFMKGRQPAVPFTVAQIHLEEAKKRIAEGRNVVAALEHAVESAADEGERDINYWHLEVDRLEDLPIPASLLQPPRLSIAIAVLRHAADQHPRYLVLLATSSTVSYERPQAY